MLQSSTPDGLAPLSAVGVLVFASIICLLFILWAVFNLVLLLRLSEEAESAERSERVREITRKIFLASVNLYKLDVAVSLVAMLIFFLVIMVYILPTILGGLEQL